jgi:lipid A disaccharide synthetase
MANLLAGREIIQEFIQREATATNLAAESLRLLDDQAYRATMRKNFQAVRENLQTPATTTPAQAVLEALV